MELEADLSKKFHNLPGSTVEEKMKSFNLLIMELNSKIPEETTKNNFITDLEPKNKLETVLKVNLLLHYKIYDAVLELLKSGNSLYISKILKDLNFFRETFQSMGVTAFVNNILPYTSFTARLKIINRVSKNLSNEEQADEFFELIQEKYGIFSAQVILPHCSLEKIKAKIEKYKIVLEHRQLTMLLQRNNEFLEFYFDYIHDRHIYMDNEDKCIFLKVIFKENEQLFRKLCEKYSVKVSFGRRLSKRVLKDKDYLLKGGIDDCDCIDFKTRQVYQQLRKYRETFKYFVLKRTTNKIEEFYENCTGRRTIIGKFIYRYISEDKRYQFLNEFFKEKFGCNFHDKPELISEEILCFMPETIRENVLDVKIKEKTTLAYLYRPETAIPFIMDKIKHCSDRKTRATYVYMLFRTCEFHKHEGYLLEVLKYVDRRHRNDTKTLQPLKSLLESWENSENLSTEHWTYINRILTLTGCQNLSRFFSEKRIGYQLNNNLNINEEMQKYLDVVRHRRDIQIFTEIPKHRKLCILEMKKYIDKIEDEKELDNLLVNYLLWIYDYNMSTSSKDDIPILNYLPLLKTLLEKGYDYQLKPIVAFYVQMYYAQFNPIIWQYPERLLPLSWYMIHHRDELLNKIELIVELSEFQENKRFLRYFSLYSFRNIPERITQVIQAEKDHRDEVAALYILSLVNQEKFICISESFKPSDDGKIITDDTRKDIDLLQGIVKNLQYLTTPSEHLHIVSKFCVGDYLKYALRPLYSIISHVPEKHATSFVRRLCKSAVSVRKHAVYLSKWVFPYHDFLNIIVRQNVLEKDASLKTILFKSALRYAAIMPSSQTWELIKLTMHKIDKNDEGSFDLLLEIDLIPEEYRVIYIPKAYALIDSSPLPKVRQKRSEFISKIPVTVIDQLDCNLLNTLMAERLFGESFSPDWTNFVFYSTGEKQHVLLELALNKLEEYSKSQPKNTIDRRQWNFLLGMSSAILKFFPIYSVVNEFSTKWFSIFSPEVGLKYHFYLRLVLAYAECQYNTKTFAVKTHELLKEFLVDYNNCLFDLFVPVLTEFLDQICYENICDFVETLLTAEESIPAWLLSIRLLSSKKPKTKEESTSYKSILEKLKKRPELCIKIYFLEYLGYFEENEAD